MIFDDERIDDLEIGDLKIIQKTWGYCFSSDAVLLANFACCGGGVYCDLCSGSGVIATIIAGKSKAKKIYAVEIQPSVADMARRSVEMNGLEKIIEVVCEDLKDSPKTLGAGVCDVVVCNPPYFKVGEGAEKLSESVRISRHEIATNLSEVVTSASALLKFGGKFFIIHKSTRLAEVLHTCVEAGLEPKVLTLVYPKETKKADTFILECKKGGKVGLDIEKFVVYNEDGEMTASAKKLYLKE